jgi:hypothetical protein
MKLLSLPLLLLLPACSSAPGPVVPKTPVERKMIGLLEKFDRWDLNGDGQLGPNELKQAEKISGESAADIIQFYDSDQNGKVSLREAQRGFNRVDEAEKISEGS